MDRQPVKVERELLIGFDRGTFAALERWQMSCLPVYSLWAALVVVIFPPMFGYR